MDKIAQIKLAETHGVLAALADTGLLKVASEEDFDFIGACEDGFGAYEMCSLFSPMFEFADQAGARATAWEILGQLRRAPPALPPPAAGRRAFLTGRSPRAAMAAQTA